MLSFLGYSPKQSFWTSCASLKSKRDNFVSSSHKNLWLPRSFSKVETKTFQTLDITSPSILHRNLIRTGSIRIPIRATHITQFWHAFSNLLHIHAMFFILFFMFLTKNQTNTNFYSWLTLHNHRACLCALNREEFEFVQGASQFPERKRTHETISVDVAADGRQGRWHNGS